MFTRPLVHVGFLKSWLAGGLNDKVVGRIMQLVHARPAGPHAKPLKIYVTGTRAWPLPCSSVHSRYTCKGLLCRHQNLTPRKCCEDSEQHLAPARCVRRKRQSVQLLPMLLCVKSLDVIKTSTNTDEIIMCGWSRPLPGRRFSYTGSF